MKCSNCGSENIRSAGVLVRGKDLIRYRQFLCSECGHREELADGIEKTGSSISNDSKRYVVTSVLNNKSVDQNFLKTLESYCKINRAKLLIIPVRYISNMSGEDEWYPKDVLPYLLEDNLTIDGALCKILGGLRISATAENPLSGIDPMSKGDSLIIGHPQVQMKTLPVLEGFDSPILWTTGTVSENAYSDTKLGYKAAFNHSQSALLVDFTDDTLHIRNLNYDGEGFNDLEYRYTFKGKKKERALVLVTGDEHAIFANRDVKNATYLNSDSIIKTVKPSYIVRHDVLDSHTISHHDKTNFLKRYQKHFTGYNNLEDELKITLAHIQETSPSGVENIIVSSNHNDHLTRWLNESDPKQDPENALLYHELMFLTLSEIQSGNTDVDPFELWVNNQAHLLNVVFTHRKSVKFSDIEVGIHGDKGANGTRGSRASFAKLPEKCIIGHSHSPGWEKGCVQVGTSSNLNMGYNSGSPSSWRHAHCIIHLNGKRQVVFVTNGKWR